MMPQIEYNPRGSGCVASLTNSSDLHVTVTVESLEEAPTLEGSEEFLSNVALMTTLVAFVANELAYRRLRSPEKRASHRAAADKDFAETLRIAAMIERLTEEQEVGWCSGCFEKAKHRHVRGQARPRAKFLCQNCGTPTTNCSVPRCAHFAIVASSARTTLCYCAEHNHQIPGFEKLTQRLSAIDTLDEWLAFESFNAGRLTKVMGGTLATAAVVGPLSFFAAPVIGAALGGSVLGGSLTGAAATSHGLAMLGGGSLAAGGLGMAGGTAVVTATGSAIGGILGAATTTAYVGSDKSFRIEKLRDGTGNPVLLASGFLTQNSSGWGEWQPMIDQRYPDAPVYAVRWGAKELKSIAVLATSGAAKVAVRKVLVELAKKGSKSFGRLPGLGAVFAVRDVATNPWTVAKNRAGMTGAVLADLIARIDSEAYVLVGHSLGARVMVTAAQTLGTKEGPPRIASMHLFGAAVGHGGDWRNLDAAVSGTVWNYWSKNDEVLRLLYAAAEFRQKAIGQVGFRSKFKRIKDRNVSQTVTGHSGYFAGVRLAN